MPDAEGSRAAAWLAHLAQRPPQTLLLEGGAEEERLATALRWAALLNCPQSIAELAADRDGAACGGCAICHQIEANECADLLIYDGRIPNTQDIDNPGPIKAMRIDNLRDLKRMTGEAPHGSGKRVAVFQGITQSREEAMNSLLKTLEEPSPHTRFVLLAPQRQQLLPTLVSRSFCITLPWRGCAARDPASRALEEDWACFLAGRRLLAAPKSARGAADAASTARMLFVFQEALARALSGRADGPLDCALLPLAAAPVKAATASRWLNEAQEMLAAAVAPGRILDAFAMRVWSLARQQ